MLLRAPFWIDDQRLQAAAKNRPPLRRGQRGDAIRLLQTALLHCGLRLPITTRKMTVVPDGIFGRETETAVKDFQRSSRLASDGLPGRMTLRALDGVLLSTQVSPTQCCGTGLPENRIRVNVVEARLKQLLDQAASRRRVAAFSGSGSAKGSGAVSAFPLLDDLLESLGGIEAPSGIRLLSASQMSAAMGVYGSSLEFSKIFLSDGTGASGRAFTVAVPLGSPLAIPPRVGPSLSVVVINVGTFSPSNSLLIHELAHAWQSQHHPIPTAFMTNSVASQGLAAAVGGNASAYCYVPGKPFKFYAAEQIAQQVENGEPAIVGHVASLSAGVPDPMNMESLTLPRYEIRGAPGVRGF